MIQFCAFGGYEGRLQPGKRLIITMFGGADLRVPTLARRLLSMRRRQAEGVRPHRLIIVTLFGGTEITWPTLAEEFIELREAVSSGAIHVSEWDAMMSELSRLEDGAIVTLTLFGGLEETALPSEDTEIDALALQRHLGNIPESAGRVLEFGIGQPDAQRRAVLRQAIAV